MYLLPKIYSCIYRTPLTASAKPIIPEKIIIDTDIGDDVDDASKWLSFQSPNSKFSVSPLPSATQNSVGQADETAY